MKLYKFLDQHNLSPEIHFRANATDSDHIGESGRWYITFGSLTKIKRFNGQDFEPLSIKVEGKTPCEALKSLCNWLSGRFIAWNDYTGQEYRTMAPHLTP